MQDIATEPCPLGADIQHYRLDASYLEGAEWADAMLEAYKVHLNSIFV